MAAAGGEAEAKPSTPACQKPHLVAPKSDGARCSAVVCTSADGGGAGDGAGTVEQECNNMVDGKGLVDNIRHKLKVLRKAYHVLSNYTSIWVWWGLRV